VLRHRPLQALARRCSGIVVQGTSEPTGRTALVSREVSAALQAVAPYSADFDRTWSIASYSRLTRDLKRVAAGAPVGTDLPVDRAISPLQVLRPADDEAPVLAAGGRAELLAPDPPLALGTPVAGADAPAIWHSFKRGPVTGNFLHELLDALCRESFDLLGNASLRTRIQARCEREGHGEAAPAMLAWMTDVVQQPLPGPGVSLAGLTSARSEMEFWLPSRQIETARIDTLCRTHLMAGVERPALQTSTLHGMLMGFIDLVFEHEGRYWVLDYKSNALGADDGAYDSPGLQRSMAEHRYDVQAAIYALALHRLLKARLGSAYAPERHLGGAVYLFLRGIHGPAAGACTLEFPAELLQALDAMLEPAAAQAD
jgi:exodeoxyribonuclease V beta subunit